MALLCLVFVGCHTSHDIRMEITLNIRHVEATVTPENAVQTRDLNGNGPFVSGLPEDMGPEVRKAVVRRSARLGELAALKKEGAIGETNEGKLLVFARSLMSLSAERKTEIETLVKEENADREMIYGELARLRNYTLQEKLILPQVLAEEIRSGLEPGDWFQVPGSPDFFIRFRDSVLGRLLQDKAERAAWLQVPAGYSPSVAAKI
jgi:uncharacterized protein YdbL (DUF1318 family)